MSRTIPGAIQADEVQFEGPLRTDARGCRAMFDGDLQAALRKLLDRRDEARNGVGRRLHTQDAGELPREMCHAALQPVPAGPRHGLSDGFDQPGPIGADDGHHDILHRIPLLVTLPRRSQAESM